MKKDQLTGIVLCGGKSSRMGTDKGLLSYKNNTLIQNAIGSIERYCSDILLSTNNEAYGPFGYKLVEDRYKNIGPIGGLFSGLSESTTSQCLITACDIPHIEKEILDRMIVEAGRTQHVLLKLSSGYFQPFPVILSGKSFSLIENQIQTKNYKLQDLYSRLEQQPEQNVSIITIETEPENINTKNDLLK